MTHFGLIFRFSSKHYTEKIFYELSAIGERLHKLSKYRDALDFSFQKALHSKSKHKKVVHKVEKILFFLDASSSYFKKISDDFDFSKNYDKFKDTKEEKIMLAYLDIMRRLLNKVFDYLKNLSGNCDFLESPTSIDEINFSLEKYFKEQLQFIAIEKNIELNLISLIDDIYNNYKVYPLVIDGNKKELKCYVSHSKKDLSILDNLPLLNLDNVPNHYKWVLYKRSYFFTRLHTDDSLDIPHYNVLFDGGRLNIHVIPHEYKKKILNVA